jgi:hypothetical protein
MLHVFRTCVTLRCFIHAAMQIVVIVAMEYSKMKEHFVVVECASHGYLTISHEPLPRCVFIFSVSLK